MPTLTVQKPAPQRSLWPYAIIAVFVLFATFIGYMVKQAMSSSVDLVSKDYYEQELQHQQRMEATARTQALPAQVTITYDETGHDLGLQIPAALTSPQPTGKVQFFRPSDQRLDFTVPLQVDATGAQHLSTARLKPGYWRIRLDFTAGGEAYFQEKNISVGN
ncbi:FixH family protein [Hymenobacter busanensis]|uniref:FixH family protein n=1 Tax=Hymenobacter busanensis TaxID=2607656 RepID=A0A7L4ZUV3_9BACT|nr:FixH family protein [Hymenobacter busanensis]KAA9327688.1 FixH family protein [Hymenobacter busanensis]QHJ05972.1 nitrogen fixation protein FixH [Hymenobacter busanensis]